MRPWHRVARFFGWRPDDDHPLRLIDLPGQFREPSLELLRRLRAVDSQAEVVYVGAGRWWVGRVKEAPHRRARGRRMVERLQESDGFPWAPGEYWPQLRQGLLMAQGFGLVVDELIQGEPDAKLVHEFTVAMWVERGGVLKTDATRVAQALRRDRLKAQADQERQIYRWLHSRSANGRGNPWIGYGGGRPIATQRTGSLIV